MSFSRLSGFHQDDDRRLRVLRRRLAADARLLPVGKPLLRSVVPRQRLLRRDVRGICLRLYQPVHLRRQVRPGQAHAAASPPMP